MLAHPCQAPLPRGPHVPAAIVLRTSCGRFRLATDGRVTRLPRLRGGGTGRRFEADVNIRRTPAGRYVLLEHGRVFWRSSRLYPNDGGSVAFGPHRFAFGSYRRGVFVTDLRGRERLVVRGRDLYPLDFTRTGALVVGGGGTLAVVAPAGNAARRFAYRQRNVYAFDERTDSVVFVTPRGILATVHDGRLTLGRRLRGVDGTIGFVEHGLLVFGGLRAVVIARRDGAVVARASWPPSLGGPDSGVSVSRDGRSFAFRVTNAYPGGRWSRAVVYVLRAGATSARLVYRHALGPSGCAVGAELSWRGRFLLYTSIDGQIAVLDSRGGLVTSLARLALPRRWPLDGPSASWAG